MQHSVEIQEEELFSTSSRWLPAPVMSGIKFAVHASGLRVGMGCAQYRLELALLQCFQR